MKAHPYLQDDLPAEYGTCNQCLAADLTYTYVVSYIFTNHTVDNYACFKHRFVKSTFVSQRLCHFVPFFVFQHYA